MKVLVATSQSQGAAPDDFCFTIEGELVWFPPPCDRGAKSSAGDCGCRRSMGGLASHRATTTVITVSRPGLRFEDLVTAIADSIEAQGYHLTLPCERVARDQAIELTKAANEMDPGTVLDRRGDYLCRRFFIDDVGWVALGAFGQPSDQSQGW
jgi:hypothetical protein